jgi:hypothetical protein
LISVFEPTTDAVLIFLSVFEPAADAVLVLLLGESTEFVLLLDAFGVLGAFGVLDGFGWSVIFGAACTLGEFKTLFKLATQPCASLFDSNWNPKAFLSSDLHCKNDFSSMNLNLNVSGVSCITKVFLVTNPLSSRRYCN